LFNNLKAEAAVFLSKVFENCAIDGGTFNLKDKIFFCLCNLTYSGHLTNLDKFFFG
jgi:hypothetical protein